MKTRRFVSPRTRGYTAVEVLSAMTLFAIGAAGVIGMQKTTVQGGEDARRFDMATNIANEWAARLQRDAMFWTKPNNIDDVSNLPSTRFIKDVAIGACNTGWCTPGTTLPAPNAEMGVSPAFDVFGRDRPAGSDDHMFCVQYRMNWIANPVVNGNPAMTSVMRVEVRVLWTRLEYGQIGNCAALPQDPDGVNAMRTYHFVHTTTSVRKNMER